MVDFLQCARITIGSQLGDGAKKLAKLAHQMRF
ncbi:hypothetical protein DSM3645_07261 [Blastopirellula marina DSM 3645]|uniref:Uncharacterized protein n=1 Tax=Blastopirellula marina DSM 3645 TaxID=314230 RepID=A3ZYK8_9BACT|nr:hypothetical protein DSM3645_07261 [Blastopirellula marina DSM 3645]